MRLISLFAFATVSTLAQMPVTIRVDAGRPAGKFPPIFAYFGYDEPNYTYTRNGSKLVAELARLSATPVYLRTHFLLATGDGTPGLKWGSTNAYKEDAAGKPVYDWTIADRIFDTYLQAGAKPFVEIGFMPRALSSHPEPYQATWVPGGKNEGYGSGWSYPPADYQKWGELVYQWVKHCMEKYGRAEASSWYWEVWNEPDISYWHGTPAEYDKLYDYAAGAVKRALPEARVGGPATTGPANERAAAFLRQFLEHCSSGANAATGNTGAPLDFVTYHAKGRPTVADGHVRMGIAKNAEDVETGFRIVTSFPKFRDLPIVLSESDPEGCAACSARVYPQNAYRNGALYASYTAAMMKTILELADREKANIQGMLTWAFQFEDQPYFDGFRTLATNGIDKPVLNLFRMLGMMRGERIETSSEGRAALGDIVRAGVGGKPDVDALAVRADREVAVLVWNYQDDDVAADAAQVSLLVQGVPARFLLQHYRIDETHGNAWTAWKKMGSPQKPSAEQYRVLEEEGQLRELESPRWVSARNGEAAIPFELPRQGVSLLRITW